MRPVSEGDILRKQWQRSQRMQDSGYIVRQVAGVWTPDADPTRCTVQDGGSRTGNITFLPAGTPADAIELPYGTDIDTADRFRLTMRSGLAIPPIEYIPIDQPRRDSVSVLIEVRKVAT